jgi:hypothetical protein
MNRRVITALVGVCVLLLAPSAGRAAASPQPAYGKAMADDSRLKPQPVQGSFISPDGKPPPKKAAPQGPGKPNYAAPGPGKPNSAGPGPGRPDSYRRGDYRRGDYRRGPPPGPGYRYVGPPPRAYYRPWGRRPYYGTIIAGVALGTIIGVTAYGLIPPRPDPDLCWYWADPYRSRGYWDYCD